MNMSRGVVGLYRVGKYPVAILLSTFCIRKFSAALTDDIFDKIRRIYDESEFSYEIWFSR